jgi:pSer/pThr/pTyr-binding forkhead associated (FHA) protein
MFDTASTERQPPAGIEEDPEWLDAVRSTLETEGDFLVYRDEERVSVLPLGREWTKIGRSLTADIRLDDPTVSRRHALICRQPEGVRVLDDRSLNGVFLNGERTEWAPLEDGDELTIGRYRLHFLALGKPRRGSASPSELTTA